MKFSLLSFLLIFAFSFSARAQAENERGRGVELYRQGEYAKAVELLQAHLGTEDKDRIAWLYLGGSFVKLKKDDEAAKAFRKTTGVYKKNPPVYDKPLKIISKKPPAYTEAARSNLTAGTIKVAVEYKADGTIGFVFPITNLPDGLTESAVRAAEAIRFEPAVQSGKTVTVISTVEYSFMI